MEKLFIYLLCWAESNVGEKSMFISLRRYRKFCGKTWGNVVCFVASWGLENFNVKSEFNRLCCCWVQINELILCEMDS